MTPVFWSKKHRPPLMSILTATHFDPRVLQVIFERKYRNFALWMVVSTGMTLMLAWNWKLVLATSTGIGSLLLIFLSDRGNWQRYWSIWRQLFSGSQGKLAIAACSGGAIAVGTYLAAAIWSESEHRWLAVGSILQGLGTLMTLGLVSWQIFSHRQQLEAKNFEQWLRDLTQTDALKRLIAVRQLANYVSQQPLSSRQRQQLEEYYCYMLSTETEPLVRQAIAESLQFGARPQTSVPIPLKPLLRVSQPILD